MPVWGNGHMADSIAVWLINGLELGVLITFRRMWCMWSWAMKTVQALWQTSNSLISGQLCSLECQLELLGALQYLWFPKDLVGDNQSLPLLHGVIYFTTFTQQFIIYLCDSCYLLCCSFHVAKNERFYGTLGFHASDGATLILFLHLPLIQSAISQVS